MYVVFKNNMVEDVSYGHPMNSIRPKDVRISLSEINIDWDDPKDRDTFCNYIEHLQKQCRIIK